MLSQIIFIALIICGEAVLFDGDRLAECFSHFTHRTQKPMKKCYN